MKKFYFMGLFALLFANTIYAQDTLSGNYDNLTIVKGKHIINSMVIVSNTLKVDSGAKIEFIDNGTLVCGGLVEMLGNNHDIEFYGKKNNEGVGLIFNNNNEKSILINNVTFRNLQMPLYFDFGWKRNLVSITNNIFTKNIGTVSLIQVLNPPFGINDSTYVQFELANNLFSENKSSIYFEDLKSDQIHFDISQNVFINNSIYGSKAYNIASNMIYTRLDQSYKKYTPILERNSFVNNNLVDILTDTIVHSANIGVYGTEKSIIFKNNYWGDNNKYKIYEGVYDQEKSYALPKLNLEPFLNLPLNNIFSHIYKVYNSKNGFEIQDTISQINRYSSFILRSNKEVDFSTSKLTYINLKNDTTLLETENAVKFNINVIDKNNVRIDLLDTKAFSKSNGYFKLSNIIDLELNYVPNVYLGYKQYLKHFYYQKRIIDSIANLKGIDEEADKKIAKNPPFKKFWEFGIGSGGSIFTGTVSSPAFFNNEVNLNHSAILSYYFSRALSTSLLFSYFDLGNTDSRSSNLDEVSRGFHFTTNVISITPSINIKLSESKLSLKKKYTTSYLSIGLDILHFNPTGSYKGKIYNLHDLGTGGQYIDKTKSPYSLYTEGLMLSYRFNINFSNKNTLSLLLAYHRTFTDYLDDVGPDLYPNADILFTNSNLNGAAAVYFSNPTSDYIVPGRLRSSPSNPTDSYLSFNIIFSRKLFK